jgi:transposase
MARRKRSHPDRDIVSPLIQTLRQSASAPRCMSRPFRPDRDAEPVRSFGTFTGDLQRLADWFECCGNRTIAMESTEVYWIPVFEILDQRGFEVVLVNARDADTGLKPTQRRQQGSFAIPIAAVNMPPATTETSYRLPRSSNQ